jgi:hypothetical protein
VVLLVITLVAEVILVGVVILVGAVELLPLGTIGVEVGGVVALEAAPQVFPSSPCRTYAG